MTEVAQILGWLVLLGILASVAAGTWWYALATMLKNWNETWWIIAFRFWKQKHPDDAKRALEKAIRCDERKVPHQ